MNATVNVVLFKSKTLANGEHPLMIRVCKDNKKKYKSLGISIHPQHWDFEKNSPRKNCPNKDYIKKIVADKLAEYSEQILELASVQKDYTVSTLIESKQEYKTVSVYEFFQELITENRNANKIGNAKVYKDTLATLHTFKNTNCLDIPFSDIDTVWLMQYEKWMISRNYTETSISLRFRTIRSVFNKAIERKLIKKDVYPFDDFKVSKFNTRTDKRAITKNDIKKIMNLDLSHESKYMQLSQDVFVFSYLQGGINFTDIANLKYENIVDDRLHYIRQKTKKRFNIQIQEESMNILNKYIVSDASKDDYIFPILDKKLHKTAIQKHNRIHKVIGYINPNLKLIAQKAGIEPNLTTYVARHTYATVLKRSGVNTSIISESLGHSSEKITQIYLDSFENSQIDEAMKNLL
ncbi:MAG: site-specific integrase [Dysgonomonas sp.]|nr:site-specific integrase [Dysgonomonas sp.]